MRKSFLFLSLFLSLSFFLSACHKNKALDDEIPFSKEEAEVLSTLKGSWRSVDSPAEETLTFSPFKSLKAIEGVDEDNKALPAKYFHGAIDGDFKASTSTEGFAGDFSLAMPGYFSISIEQHRINCYFDINDAGKYCSFINLVWEYEIVDNDTIRLHDTDLSDFHWYTYKRVHIAVNR